jgi:hypothetical protein
MREILNFLCTPLALPVIMQRFLILVADDVLGMAANFNCAAKRSSGAAFLSIIIAFSCARRTFFAATFRRILLADSMLLQRAISFYLLKQQTEN